MVARGHPMTQDDAHARRASPLEPPGRGPSGAGDPDCRYVPVRPRLTTPHPRALKTARATGGPLPARVAPRLSAHCPL